MKLLLTSGGVTNASILAALRTMIGKPIEESTALLIPTAQWGHPMCSPQTAWKSTAGRWPGRQDLVELGWKSVGVLELTALPSIEPERWKTWVREADVLLVEGGEAMYLAHWMRESGLAALLPELTETVWVGISAGSMVLTPRVGPRFVDWRPDAGDEALGVVGFSLFPHLDYPGWTENTSDSAREWAETIGGPAYGIDDQTAVSVVDGDVRVVSEGNWIPFNLEGDRDS
ncbi:Type 1 glutamine amidotransferase-like domain-containing protein [Microbacterium sp. PMB16]|uniref:Type 1 glutamine amidotransferase-like domain-containing protein n=1 Tax=Microbacterium sp. PMB16 TaxID=3120157 RepID=UPI003F4C612B